MISHLHLRNFKSIKNRCDVSLKPYTFIYGPNSAGKTSLIQSLLLLRQSSFERVLFKGETLDLGTFTNVVSGQVGGYDPTFQIGISSENFGNIGHFTESFKWSIEFEINRNSLPGKDGLGNFKELKLSLSSAIGQMKTMTFKTAQTKKQRIGGPNLSKWTLTDPILLDGSGSYPVSDPEKIYGILPNIFNPQKSDSALWDYLGFTNHLEVDDLARLNKFMTKSLEEIFDMAHVPPVRNMPPDIFINDLRLGVPNTYSFYSDLAKEPAALDGVNNALNRLEIKYRLMFNRLETSNLNPRVQGTGSFALIPNDLNVNLGFQDVGYGVSQVIPVLAAVFSKNAVIAIEQPELHLHPRLQGRLADILISAHKINRSQFLIETHSESLMLRIQRKIRDAELNSDDVKIIYVDPIGNGYSSVMQIELDQNGNFVSEWPGGFFEERFDDIF